MYGNYSYDRMPSIGRALGVINMSLYSDVKYDAAIYGDYYSYAAFSAGLSLHNHTVRCSNPMGIAAIHEDLS